MGTFFKFSLVSLAGDEVHKSIKFLFSLAPKGERESEGEGFDE
jgi:hypothetical protein